MIKAQGASFVLVLGDPAYYSRSGFYTEHNIQPPYSLPYPEAWMALALQGSALMQVKGRIRCADALNAPEHW
jgi:predicted N-acetyltransferase YhbS